MAELADKVTEDTKVAVHTEMLRLIKAKRNGEEHDPCDIFWLINHIDYIEEHQLAAWLMAAAIKGLTKLETRELTSTMAHSGHVLTLKRHAEEYDPNHPELLINNRGFVDKHSTGGVGDKVTLVLAPLLASVGFKLSKFSGRALGHTGGTVDKLESIPGFRTDIDMQSFEKQIEKVGLAVAGQTLEFAPADKRLYNLRDKTATIDAIPLIAASVMSKKIAGGADIILLDVKVGAGAFMKDLQQAKELAKQMKEIGDGLNLDTKVFLTNMDQPLGHTVGNALEMQEAIDMLDGKITEGDFYEIVLELASSITVNKDHYKNTSFKDLRKELEQSLRNGKAYIKFEEWIETQSGDLEAYKASLTGTKTLDYVATEEAWVKEIDALAVGKAIHNLGYKANPAVEGGYDIDNLAGVTLHAKVGDKLVVGDKIFTVQASSDAELQQVQEAVLDAYLV